jgi:hypothetical protein
MYSVQAHTGTYLMQPLLARQPAWFQSYSLSSYSDKKQGSLERVHTQIVLVLAARYKGCAGVRREDRENSVRHVVLSWEGQTKSIRFLLVFGVASIWRASKKGGVRPVCFFLPWAWSAEDSLAVWPIHRLIPTRKTHWEIGQHINFVGLQPAGSPALWLNEENARESNCSYLMLTTTSLYLYNLKASKNEQEYRLETLSKTAKVGDNAMGGSSLKISPSHAQSLRNPSKTLLGTGHFVHQCLIRLR